MATGLLLDGPAEGELVTVEITDRRLAQLFVTVAVPVLDEHTETFEWADTRYARMHLRHPKTDPDEPWEYFWWDRPERPHRRHSEDLSPI